MTDDRRDMLARDIREALGVFNDDALPVVMLVKNAAAALTAQAEEIERLRMALEPFVRHGRALGVYDGADGPFWIMTDSGHRDVPAEDFRAALKAAQEVKA